jgi:hypothetical protein
VMTFVLGLLSGASGTSFVVWLLAEREARRRAADPLRQIAEVERRTLRAMAEVERAGRGRWPS